MKRPFAKPKPFDPGCLTERQTEVVKRLCEGKSYQEIADELVYSQSTINNEVYKIHRKTRTISSTQLAYLVGLHEGSNNGHR